MQLIDQAGKRVRKVCDRCHRLSVSFGRGEVCGACQAMSTAFAKEASRNARLLFTRALAVQDELRQERVG